MSKFERHLENNLMLRYALYLEDPDNSDYDGHRLSQADISGIRSHVRECPACFLKLEEIRNDFLDLTNYLDNEGLSGISTHPVLQPKERVLKIPQVKWSSILPAWRFRLAMAAAAVLILVTSSFYFMKPDQPYLSLATFTKEDLSASLRSGTSTELHQAILSYQNEEYGAASRHFQAFLSDKEQTDLRTFAHYYAGLSFLMDSQETFLGQTIDFNVSKVDRGIGHLQKVLDSTDNIHYIEDAQWHLAKAYLIKEDKAKAMSALTSILDYQGRRRGEALSLLKQLNDSQ